MILQRAVLTGLICMCVGLPIGVPHEDNVAFGSHEDEPSPLSRPERQPSFQALLHSDLVIRGSVLSVLYKSELFNEAMPQWPVPAAEGHLINVAYVRVLVDEVLRGTAPGDTAVFLVYVGMSGRRYNYEAGQEMVVGLVWGHDVLGGMYWLYDDAGRVVRTSDGWRQQSDDQPLVDLETVERVLATVTPSRVLADADAIVVGNLRRELLEYRFAPNGHEYALMTYVLSETEVLKGRVDTPSPEICAITSGEYWPEWRDNATFPRLKRGQRYCFFLRRTDTGFAVVAGMSGAYEIQNGSLILPGRKSVVLTIDEVKEAVSGNE